MLSCIDTWGDFGMIDKDGELIDTPFSYRDEKYAYREEKKQSQRYELEILKQW